MVLYTCTFEFSVWCCRETVLRWDVGLLEFPKEGSERRVRFGFCKLRHDRTPLLFGVK
jgi:hypothetical protein